MEAGGDPGRGTAGPAVLLGRVVLLVVVYVVAAKLALKLAIPPGYAAAIWPPSGIALAALLLYGRGLWPGVLIAAVAVNLMIQGSPLVAVLTGTGNTVEAVVAASLVRRYLGPRGEFDSGEAAAKFVLLVMASACISALVGSLAITLTGIIDPADFTRNLFVWLQGDASGMMIFTPLILIWRRRPPPSLSRARWMEAIALGICVIMGTVAVFGHTPLAGALHRLTFLTFPLVLWAALRFRQRAVITATAVISLIAAWYTRPGRNELDLWTATEISFYMLFYTGSLVVTGLVLAATMAQRRRAEAAVRQRVHGLLDSERRINEFLAMLSHELRNPLAAIVNAVATLRREHSGNPRTLGIIERQAAHFTHLVGDLLDVSRIARGKISLTTAPVELKALVLRTLESANSVIEARHHALELDLDASGPTLVDADAMRISQAILNLVTNAAKYTPPGGRITISLAREGEQAVLRVRDTGIGIPPELLPDIFELFTQGDQSIARTEGGLGIGLTIARRVVEMHGGTLTAASEGPGRGSVFEMRLPALPEAAASEAQPANPDAAVASRRILVVDDNRDGADSLAMYLGAMGHQVTTAYDGPTGIRLAAGLHPDVVLLDIGLPGMDGYQVAEELRRAYDPAHMTLVAVTGYGQEEDRARSREAGFDHHLVKPVDPGELDRIVNGRA